MAMVDNSLISALCEGLGERAVLLNEPMSKHTTFRIGGPADVLVMPQTEEQAAFVVRSCRAASVPLRVIGRGSDLLVADTGLSGVVMKIAGNLADVRVNGSRIEAQTGASNARIAEAAAQAALTGYEFAAGIPGTVGGAAIMNAGAYGGEFRDVACRLVCLNAAGEVVSLRAYEAQWGYRCSAMDTTNTIVLRVILQLMPGNTQDIRDRMADLSRRRREKQPLEMPSAGSTFKRPVGYFAGKLIEDAGLRGFSIGGAQVSQKHTGFVVNADGATASDVRTLIREVQRRVRENSGVDLHPEVRCWGFKDE